MPCCFVGVNGNHADKPMKQEMPGRGLEEEYSAMRVTFRNGFYAGLLLAIGVGLYLFQLWRPERQVRLHSIHLLETIEQNKWARLADFLDEAYQDQWGQDRALVITRLRSILPAVRNLRLEVMAPATRAGRDEGEWSARITLEADPNEVSTYVKDRVNTLDAPFELRWRRIGKLWEWKLVSVRNSALEIPTDAF